jgi:hypothetical protein
MQAMEMIRITGGGSETLIRDAGRIERFLIGDANDDGFWRRYYAKTRATSPNYEVDA